MYLVRLALFKNKLFAAFDHRHIFIDPDPAQTFYEERLVSSGRQALPEDYNPKLISQGVCVETQSKSIPPTAEMQNLAVMKRHLHQMN